MALIIILELLLLFVFVVLKRDYHYHGYSFHLDNVNLYTVSSGKMFAGETIAIKANTIHFHGAVYTFFVSGYKDNGFHAEICSKDGRRYQIGSGVTGFNDEEELALIENFIWAVYARNSPVAIMVIVILDFLGWIFVNNPKLFFLLNSWKYEEELNPSVLYLNVMRLIGYSVYGIGIYLLLQYLFSGFVRLPALK